MAQETGTQILARARVFAQDNDAGSNFSVSAADALILLNDLLVSLSNNVRVKPKWLGASVTGLTFASGTTSVVTSLTADMTEIESFHPANAAVLDYPITPALNRISVQEMLQKLAYTGDAALAATQPEWTHVAAEKAQSDTAAAGLEKWRVWAYPVINRTRYMTIRAPMPVSIALIGDYPDLDAVDSRVVSRLLAYEIAKLKKESSAAFLQSILSTVPKNILQQVYGEAVRGSQLQDRILQVFE